MLLSRQSSQKPNRRRKGSNSCLMLFKIIIFISGLLTTLYFTYFIFCKKAYLLRTSCTYFACLAKRFTYFALRVLTSFHLLRLSCKKVYLLRLFCKKVYLLRSSCTHFISLTSLVLQKGLLTSLVLQKGIYSKRLLARQNVYGRRAISEVYRRHARSHSQEIA